ncbi:MAG TPA: tRNA lysidine(34) synthetase TilS [Nitrospiraceae bacterium]|nr:tRNA lysidine(34) synthetase TilS [Nitrospiraceae bacterium]
MALVSQLERAAIRHKLERHVAASARSRQLFSDGDHLLVAVSGGPDSVALLSVLASLALPMKLTLSALHVNYGLRGDESEEDARFVSRLCADLDVPLICERVDLSRTSAQHKGASRQARARDVRYAALRHTAAAVGANKIALGHTADDQAETLIMWMLRGAGAAGMAGIRPVRDAVYVRPLLDVSRAAVLSFLRAKGQAFRTDSSNAKPVYLRNRIRHELMPLLKQFNPAILETLTRQAAILRDEDLCLEQWVSKWIRRYVLRGEDLSLTIPCKALLKLPIALQRRVVRRVVQWTTGSLQGPTFGAAEAVLKKIVRAGTGSSLALRGARVAREYERIRFFPVHGMDRCTEEADKHGWDRAVEVHLGIPSVAVWPPTGQVVSLTFADDPPTEMPAGQCVARFDADRFTHRLMLRSWRAGDVFHPHGMEGRRKKIQDYFSDIKLPRARRAEVPLLVAPEGILWVAGHRADHRFRVTPSTRRIVTVEIAPAGTDKEGKG